MRGSNFFCSRYTKEPLVLYHGACIPSRSKHVLQLAHMAHQLHLNQPGTVFYQTPLPWKAQALLCAACPAWIQLKLIFFIATHSPLQKSAFMHKNQHQYGLVWYIYESISNSGPADPCSLPSEPEPDWTGWSCFTPSFNYTLNQRRICSILQIR